LITSLFVDTLRIDNIIEIGGGGWEEGRDSESALHSRQAQQAAGEKKTKNTQQAATVCVRKIENFREGGKSKKSHQKKGQKEIRIADQKKWRERRETRVVVAVVLCMLGGYLLSIIHEKCEKRKTNNEKH
jgi:hypothetical protein